MTIYLLLTLMLLLALTSVSGQGRKKAQRNTIKPPSSSVRIQAAEAQMTKLPVGYIGHNAGSIFGSVRGVRASLRKSQFETTPDYESRVEQIVSKLPGVSSRLTFLIPDAKVKYDADNGAFHIETQPESVYFPDVYMAGDWSRQYSDFTSFFLVWDKKTIGSAVSRNAFGVGKRYVITAYTSLRLAVPASSVSKLNRGLLLPATPSSARVMYSGIRLALTGHLIPPFGGEETDTDTATITDPEEAHYFKYYIYFRPDTAVVYDIRTGEVYGSLTLTEEDGSGRLAFTSSKSPILLEDPLTRQLKLEEAQRARQLKLEEARREYPPEHVFKLSEVTVKAVITSKPDPGFTEEARAQAVSGTVRLRAILKYDGTVEIEEIMQGLPFGLTERTVESAKRIRFRPAQRNGRPVSQSVTLEYNFNVY